jgi:hypothetical protein
MGNTLHVAENHSMSDLNTSGFYPLSMNIFPLKIFRLFREACIMAKRKGRPRKDNVERYPSGRIKRAKDAAPSSTTTRSRRPSFADYSMRR